MPSRSASMGLNTVAWPWPVDCTLSPSTRVSPPGKLSAVPSSGKPPACSSMQEMPNPRYLPRLAASRRRCLKPSWSASANALSSTVSNSPLSMVVPTAVLYGIADDLIRLRRRSLTGSMPVTRAASSITRSRMKLASGRPAPR